MARNVREWDPKHRQPTAGRDANQAISDWTAQHATQVKGKQLTKAFKKSERKLTLAGTAAQAHSKAAARYSDSLGQANAGLTRQQQQTASLARRLQQAQQQRAKEIAKEPNYATMTKSQQKAYFDRQMKRLPEQKMYDRAVAQYNDGTKSYQAQVSRYDTLSNRVTRANKRIQALNKQYLLAHRRLKQHRYVPYSPA